MCLQLNIEEFWVHESILGINFMSQFSKHIYFIFLMDVEFAFSANWVKQALCTNSSLEFLYFFDAVLQDF